MNSAKCRQCGFVGWGDAEVCKKCGASMLSDVPPQTFQPQGSTVAPSYPGYSIQSEPQLRNGLAITALVMGILNFMLLGIFVIPSIVGIVVSGVALKKINRSPHEYGGKSMAIGGLVMNIVSAVFLIPVMLIAAIAIRNLLAAARAANEAAAIRSLRIIQDAEQTYHATRGQGRYGTLADLQHDRLISADLASGMKSGYRFKLEVIAAGPNDLPEFEAVAVPKDYPMSGIRSFFVDQTGVIRGEDRQGLEANRSTPPVGLDRDPGEARSQRLRPPSSSDDE